MSISVLMKNSIYTNIFKPYSVGINKTLIGLYIKQPIFLESGEHAEFSTTEWNIIDWNWKEMMSILYAEICLMINWPLHTCYKLPIHACDIYSYVWRIRQTIIFIITYTLQRSINISLPVLYTINIPFILRTYIYNIFYILDLLSSQIYNSFTTRQKHLKCYLGYKLFWCNIR